MLTAPEAAEYAWKQGEHISAQLPQGQGGRTWGSSTCPNRATKLQAAELQQLHMERQCKHWSVPILLQEYGGEQVQAFSHCSLEIVSSSGSWSSWQLQKEHFPQGEVNNKITRF